MPFFKSNITTLNLPSETRDTFGSPRTPLTALAAWEGISGGPTASGEMVNERTALAISTVYTCVTLLSEGIASLPCKLMKRLAKGRAEAVNNPLYELLAYSPNAEINDGAQPNQMEDDWIAHFFDKCKLVSNPEMQGEFIQLFADMPMKQVKIGMALPMLATIELMSISSAKHVEGFVEYVVHHRSKDRIRTCSPIPQTFAARSA